MVSRRMFLKTAALASVGATSLLAGCTTGRDADTGKPRVPTEPDYKGWLDGVSNYDRTIDLRGHNQVTIKVGAEGNTGSFAFSPAAVAISPDTNVVWEWTGNGGGHDVVSEAALFKSGPLVSDAGRTYEHAFEEPGVFKYYCTPHRNMGMRGVVFVALGEAGT